jgi:hypothetical protein
MPHAFLEVALSGRPPIQPTLRQLVAMWVLIVSVCVTIVGTGVGIGFLFAFCC